MREFLHATVWPANFKVGEFGRTQPKVQTGIVCRIETRLAKNFLSLYLSAVSGRNAGSHRAAVGLHALKFYLEPVVVPGNVVTQQRRGLIHVHDQNVDI